MKHLLLVDDNDRYTTILTEYYQKLGYQITSAINAADGLARFREQDKGYFSVIVTDITMESQLAGISMLGRIRAEGFPGTVVVASTGFDVFGVVNLSRLLLRRYGVHFLVRKTTVLAKEIEFWPMAFGTPPTRTFTEVN